MSFCDEFKRAWLDSGGMYDREILDRYHDLYQKQAAAMYDFKESHLRTELSKRFPTVDFTDGPSIHEFGLSHQLQAVVNNSTLGDPVQEDYLLDGVFIGRFIWITVKNELAIEHQFTWQSPDIPQTA